MQYKVFTCHVLVLVIQILLHFHQLPVAHGFCKATKSYHTSTNDFSQFLRYRARPQKYCVTNIFSTLHIKESNRRRSSATLCAKPRRLEENAEGVLYVNDRCINCAACSNFAPATFGRSPKTPHHIVHTQPSLNDNHKEELINARAALSACPVAAIRTMTSSQLSNESSGTSRLNQERKKLARALSINSEVSSLPHPFPRQLARGVWFIGHHSDRTFGATPYLVRGRYHDQIVTVMVDVPKCTPSAVRTVKSLLREGEGLDYMFLTHVDDSAHHGEWKELFPSLKRIFHCGDLGAFNWVGDESLNDVEVLLQSGNNTATNSVEEGNVITGWTLDGDHLSIDADRARSSKTDNLTQLVAHDWSSCDDSIEVDDEVRDIGDFLILYTPGHSPGSISLLFSPSPAETSDHDDHIDGGNDESDTIANMLFTGDTYAYTTRNGGAMTGFPRYGNDLPRQIQSLNFLQKLSDWWDVIASGHGHIRDYRIITSLKTGNNYNASTVSFSDEKKMTKVRKVLEMKAAINELENFNR